MQRETERMEDNIGSFNFLKMALIVALIVALSSVMGVGAYKVTTGNSIFGASGNSGKGTTVETGSVTNEEMAEQITDDTMAYVKSYLATMTDANGNPVAVSQADMQKIQTECLNEITKLLQDTDLISLSSEQLNELVKEMRESVIRNVLNSSNLSDYFTEEDYETIANYLTNVMTGDLGTLQQQITNNKTASESRDQTQDNNIESLNSKIAETNTKITNNSSSTTSAITSLKEEINKINSGSNDTNNTLATAKEDLTKLINANAALDAETKAALLKTIEDNDVKTQEDLATLKQSLLDTIDALATTDTISVASGNTSSTVTIVNSKIHTYSAIAIYYNTTSGYTVDYEQTEGKLVCTYTANYGVALPAIEGTVYIDNTVGNAVD